jgi:DNA gyrase subunit A
VRIDDQATPENEAEEAVVEEMLDRNSDETQPYTTQDRDDPPPTEPGGDAED